MYPGPLLLNVQKKQEFKWLWTFFLYIVIYWKSFRKKIKNLGYDVKEGTHPIIPIMLYDAQIAKQLSELLLKKGIYVISFSYPVVPKNEARIRVQISASHSLNQLEKTIECFNTTGKELGIIK